MATAFPCVGVVVTDKAEVHFPQFDSPDPSTLAKGAAVNVLYDDGRGNYYLNAADPDSDVAGFVSETAIQLDQPAASNDAPLGDVRYWLYVQKSGHLYRVSSGVRTYVATGYSGNNAKGYAAENNPDMQGIPNCGPIPRGLYTIGAPFAYRSPRSGRELPYTLPLTKDPGNEVRNRDGFLIHMGNFAAGAAHGASSEGCICMPDSVRVQIWTNISNDGGPRLQVVGFDPS